MRLRLRRSRLLDFLGVEGVFHQLHDRVLACGLFVGFWLIAAVFTHCEVERELAARDLVERVREQRRVLRLLGQLAVERGGRRELDREPVVGEL